MRQMGTSPGVQAAGVMTRGRVFAWLAASSARAAPTAIRMACRMETDSSRDGSPLALLPIMPRSFGESCKDISSAAVRNTADISGGETRAQPLSGTSVL